MPVEDGQARKARLLKRLAVIVDDSGRWSHRIKLCAVKSVQQSLAEWNPLKSMSAVELLEKVKPSWDTRPYRNAHGHFVQMPVSRPPQQINDVW